VIRLSTLLVLALLGCGGSDAASRQDPPRPTAPPPADPVPEPPAPPPLLVTIDTHVDTPQRMLDEGADITARLADGHLDLPRMREGQLHGAFFSIWVDPGQFPGPAAWTRALALTNVIRALPEQHPDQAAICTTVAEVRAAAAAGKIAVLLGIEGGHALGAGSEQMLLDHLRELHRLGARYMTITWSTDNVFGHASTGRHPDRGLTARGRKIVTEMNAMGMIVDVSHISDRTFEDIMAVTRRPVIASHSSARALADHPRNMTDAMIRRVAENGGAVCVNYFSRYVAGPNSPPPTVSTIADHVEHIVRVGGPGSACLGSDFDGVPVLPAGMEDVSRLPALRAELERRGLDVRAIFGENVLRVLGANEQPDPSLLQ
jgi:membrane dipeptidase